jgi:hypothetical protein
MPGDFIGALPVNPCIHLADLPMISAGWLIASPVASRQKPSFSSVTSMSPSIS